MSNEYLYVLSNPSMPGLIKVGKTTTHPDQRMAELHSTGVPTPFVLECSFAVPDCHESERKAHEALLAYRVANNREFFRISVKAAIEHILEVIGPFSLHEAKSSHNVEQLAQIINERKRESARREAEGRADLIREEEGRRNQKRSEYATLKLALQAENEKLSRLPPCPQYPQLSAVESICRFCYLPLPFGWMAWVAIIRSVTITSDYGLLGLVLFGMVVAGWFINDRLKLDEASYLRKIKPYNAIQTRLDEIKAKMTTMEREQPYLKN